MTWREIPGFDGYQVSSTGLVFRCERDVEYFNSKLGKVCKQIVPAKMLELSMDSRGKYFRVTIKGKTYDVHRLVALTFCGEPPSTKHQAAHRDGNSLNNVSSNLYWATPVENAADALRHGRYKRGEGHGRAKLTNRQAKFIRESKGPARLMADRFGVSRSLVHKIRSGETRSKT